MDRIRITVEGLRKIRSLCSDGVEKFGEVHPRGLILSKRNASKYPDDLFTLASEVLTKKGWNKIFCLWNGSCIGCKKLYDSCTDHNKKEIPPVLLDLKNWKKSALKHFPIVKDKK